MPPGPWVVPGLYTVRLSAGGDVHEQQVLVHEDPRIDIDPSVRRDWTATMLQLAELTSATSELAREIRAAVDGLAEDDESAGATTLRVLARESTELASRARSLESGAGQWVGPLSADEASQHAFIRDLLSTLRSEFEAAQGAQDGDR